MKLNLDALDVAVGEAMVIDRQARKFNDTVRWLHFGTIDCFSTGELLVVVWMVPDENYMEGCFSGYRISKDGGKTWSRRYTRGPMGWCKRAFNDGSLMELSYLTVADPPGQNQAFSGILTWFMDRGRKVCQEEMRIHFPQSVKVRQEPTVGDRVALPVMSEVKSGAVFCRSILDMPEGYLLASMYGQFEGDALDRCILVKSEDQGKTWEYFSTICGGATIQAITGEHGLEGANEPSVVQLADGRLLTIFRTRSRKEMYQCWSRDGGKTWTKPVSSGAASVLPKLLLLSNGVLACSYGRPGIQVMFSVDGTGRRWSYHVDIPVEGRGSTCYTDMVEVAPGRILLLYDTHDEDIMDLRVTPISVNSTR